jgi:2-polyprenyl-3-methyl-5-hydroxy-6-metoxy-1,4-benzoquinol methylase
MGTTTAVTPLGGITRAHSTAGVPQFRVNFEHSRFLETSSVGRRPNRLTWRSEVLLTRHADAIRDKRILDLASHDGRFSHVCLALGASHVTGVEGRSHLVAHANENLAAMGHAVDRYRFVCADIFDYLESCASSQPPFDTVLCFGVFYHMVRHAELLRRLRGLNPQHLILDTTVRKAPYARLRKLFDHRGLRTLVPQYLFRTAYLQLIREDHENEANTVEASGIVAVPTTSAVEMLLELSGFDWQRIDWRGQGIEDWTGLQDYKLEKRASYIAQPASGRNGRR